MKLFDCNTSYSDIDNEDDSLTLIENGNIVSLGKFNSNDIIHYNFSKLPTLKKIYFNKFSKNILHLISPLTNIQTIYFDELCFNVKEIFNKTNLNGNDLYNKKYNSIKCNSIGEISIDKFNFSFNTLLCFLALFPCLRLLKIRDSFKLESINIKVQYSLTTPLLLIAPIAYEADLAYYDEAERIPMLNLIKLK
ncbi:hypothetical protein K502DRAFT_350343 [Neoconidiobolus thromboides FSU 785]|nr:hypothetical protein K502DRAFT_350343 [Neoconidiobolus thromboides FSU 785]